MLEPPVPQRDLVEAVEDRQLGFDVVPRNRGVRLLADGPDLGDVILGARRHGGEDTRNEQCKAGFHFESHLRGNLVTTPLAPPRILGHASLQSRRRGA